MNWWRRAQDSGLKDDIVAAVRAFWDDPGFGARVGEARGGARVKVGECNGVGIWLVDGDAVKVSCFMDFVEGGNDAVYGPGCVHDFIPEGQVWVDAGLDAGTIPHVAIHELYERHMMKVGGLGYDEAHGMANGVEKAIMEAGIFGEVG